MQPADGSETLVVDCSLTMAWYFKDEATPYSTAVRAALATERAIVPSLFTRSRTTKAPPSRHASRAANRAMVSAPLPSPAAIHSTETSGVATRRMLNVRAFPVG